MDVQTLIERCGLKVKRATKHLDALDKSAQRFGEEHGRPGIPCVVESNSQGTKILVKVAEDPKIPDVEWGIIIGDAVHCLRSALDQLVAGLCDESATKRTGFPICHTEKDWIIKGPGQIWSVPTKYVACIDRAQPYHCGDKAHEHPLAILNALWNLDKHQAIPSVALSATGTRVKVVGATGVLGWEKLRFRAIPGRTLEKGAILAEAKFRDADTEPNAKVDVEPHLTVAVAFGEIPKASKIRGKPVGETFHDLIARAVVDVLKDVLAVHRASP